MIRRQITLAWFICCMVASIAHAQVAGNQIINLPAKTASQISNAAQAWLPFYDQNGGSQKTSRISIAEFVTLAGGGGVTAGDKGDITVSVGGAWTVDAGLFAPFSHTHAIADVTGLQTALNGKAATVHSHAIADVTNLQATLDGKAASVHTHAIADVTGLQTALDGKAASVHTHATSDIVSGTFATARFAANTVPHATLSNTSANGRLIGSPSSSGVVGEITIGSGLTLTGSTLTASGGSGTPAGANTQIQFNNSGAFGASSNLTWTGSEINWAGANAAASNTQTGYLVSRDYGGGIAINNIVLGAKTTGAPNIRLQVDNPAAHVGINVGGTNNSAFTVMNDGSGDCYIGIRSNAYQVSPIGSPSGNVVTYKATSAAHEIVSAQPVTWTVGGTAMTTLSSTLLQIQDGRVDTSPYLRVGSTDTIGRGYMQITHSGQVSVYCPSLASYSAFGALIHADTFARIGLGLDSGTPFLGFGPGNASRDVFLYRDLAGAMPVMSMRNGANAQCFRVANSWTSSTNNEFLEVGFASNVAEVGTVKGTGGGTARALRLKVDNVERMIFNTDGTNTIAGSAFPTLDMRRSSATISAPVGASRLTGISTGDMADGFGPFFSFSIRDTANVDNTIADFGAVRAGADNSGDIVFRTITSGAAQVERLRIANTGAVSIGGDQLRITSSKAPLSATDTGVAGTICWDANYIYVCTATNVWKRVALSTW